MRKKTSKGPSDIKKFIKESEQKTNDWDDAEKIAKETADAIGAAIKKKHEKKPMTISETKLGVTMVLSKEDCEELGYSPDVTTKEAILFTREKLGLPIKKGVKN